MLFELAGLKFRSIEAKDLVSNLDAGHQLTLFHESYNRFDPFAMQVIDPDTEIFIGYVPKTHSQLVCEKFLAEKVASLELAAFGDNDLKPTLRITFKE